MDEDGRGGNFDFGGALPGASAAAMSPGIEMTVGPLSMTAVRIAVLITARACSALTMRPV